MVKQAILNTAVVDSGGARWPQEGLQVLAAGSCEQV